MYIYILYRDIHTHRERKKQELSLRLYLSWTFCFLLPSSFTQIQLGNLPTIFFSSHWAWCCTSVTPAFGSWRQEELKASLAAIVRKQLRFLF